MFGETRYVAGSGDLCFSMGYCVYGPENWSLECSFAFQALYGVLFKSKILSITSKLFIGVVGDCGALYTYISRSPELSSTAMLPPANISSRLI